MIPLTVFLLGCAGVYIGTIEAAFSAIMRLSLRILAERSDRPEALGRYLEEPLLLFVPARVTLGLISAIASVLLAILVQGETESVSRAGILLLVVVGFILGSQHLVPNLLVRSDPERVLEVLLPSFGVVCRIVSPLTTPLVGIIAWRRARNVPTARAEDAEQQTELAESYLEHAEQQGLIENEERQLLQSIVEFGDTLVREVMTPRPDIVSVNVEATLGELRTLFQEQEYSRIPVYGENLDNILGFVFVKDLLRVTDFSPGERAIPRLMRPAYFVPETKRVAELLKEFQRRQVQSSIVVDEYGGTAGLVTIEDLLEEIVGEIRDEYDIEAEPIVDEGNGVFVVSGKVDIDEVAERLRVPIEREGFETLGGFLLSHLGRVPAVGETFDIGDLAVEVLEAERRRVHKVRIRRRQPVGTDAGI